MRRDWRKIGAAALAALAATPAPAAWYEASSGHFRVYAEGSAASVTALATRLERFDAGMRALRGLPDVPTDRFNPVNVYVVAGTGVVQRLCAQNDRKGGGCASIAGFYHAAAMGSTAYMPSSAGGGGTYDMNAQVVLFHEYSHHFMFENYPNAYPAWFVEGFAEFNSTARDERDGGIGFGLAAMHRAYGLVLGPGIPMTKLLDSNEQALHGEEREALYGRGWLLTHYLTFEPTRAGQLDAYLRDYARGMPSLKAAAAAFGDLRKLDGDLGRYLHGGHLKYLKLPADKLAKPEVTVRALDAGEAALMPVTIRSKRGVDGATAAAVVADARRLAAPYPSDPGAQHALMEAEYDAGDDDRAEAAADRTLAVAPGDMVEAMYKGMARLRRAQRAKVTDQAAWTEARSWIVKANRAQPDAAAPLMLFYQSFAAEGVPPTANAIKGLERAFELVPQDDGLRMLVARQMLADGRVKELRVVLAPLAYDPHAPADNPAARLIALIDAGGSPDQLRAALQADEDRRGAPAAP